MEFLNDYLVVIVVGICLCVGYVLKHVVPSEKVNKFIPMTMAVLGIVINVWLNGFTLNPEILLAGMASGLASTGMHQLFKQFIGGGAQ
jgi:Ni,Fe-hydrogenase III small subunit